MLSRVRFLAAFAVLAMLCSLVACHEADDPVGPPQAAARVVQSGDIVQFVVDVEAEPWCDAEARVLMVNPNGVTVRVYVPSLGTSYDANRVDPPKRRTHTWHFTVTPPPDAPPCSCD